MVAFKPFDYHFWWHECKMNSMYYQKATPFPHWVCKEFISKDTVSQIVRSLPLQHMDAWYRYHTPFENKLACDQLKYLGHEARVALRSMNSPEFLHGLTVLTGIDRLVPDPYMRGGGVHLMTRGGKLDVHLDFNVHPKLRLERVLNVLLFLNLEWNAEWNGALELWSGTHDGEHHALKECVTRILPECGTLVVVEAGTNTSYHGVPDVLLCPPDVFRLSLATYYYVGPAIPAKRSTVFVARPSDVYDPGLEKLRKTREQRRLESNTHVEWEPGS